MFTEDYLMRMISQVLAILMTAIGLRKAGKYSEALQAVEGAIQQLTNLPANIVDLMEDSALISMLMQNGEPQAERLRILADFFQEQGIILERMGRTGQSAACSARALRFMIEAGLAEDANLTVERVAKIEALVQKNKDNLLPPDTLLALSDYYSRLVEKDDPFLAAAGISRPAISQSLIHLQERMNSSPSSTGD